MDRWLLVGGCDVMNPRSIVVVGGCGLLRHHSPPPATIKLVSLISPSIRQNLPYNTVFQTYWLVSNVSKLLRNLKLLSLLDSSSTLIRLLS